MNSKKSAVTLSTPHPNRTRQVLTLFEDIGFSPIPEPSQHKVPTDPQPKPSPSKPSCSQQTGAIRKRRVAIKVKAAPESVTAGVLKELGVEARNNVLSHSRNLYDMYPEPIILDSDDEGNSVIAKKFVKKPKQDSKVSQSGTAKIQEEKKKERFPGSSRTSRLTRPAAGKKPNKQTSIPSSIGIPSSSKDPKTKQQTNNKLPNTHSVVLVDDDDDDESLFPVYVPATSIYKNSKKNQITEKDRLSLELEEKFPIEWSGRKKTAENKVEKIIAVENNEGCESNEIETKNNKKGTIIPNRVTRHKGLSKAEVSNGSGPKCRDMNIRNKDSHVVNGEIEIIEEPENKEEEKNNKKERTIKKSTRVTKLRGLSKGELLNGSEPKCNDNEIARSKGDCVGKGEKENPFLISCFEDITFKENNTCGGIIARCLKTDQNDIGYLEILANEVFRGQRTNITFVVVEGKAKVLHLGMKKTLSPGDMIHISADSGYQFESTGAGHVRFLYIKSHDR